MRLQSRYHQPHPEFRTVDWRIDHSAHELLD